MGARRCFSSAGPEQTRALGCRVGRLARPGLTVLLAGELGAGKTCFAQGVAEGLGVAAETPVTSPSYALLNVYAGRLPLYHFDLYRLESVADLEEFGYDDVAGQGAVTLVEWADRLDTPLAATLRVTLNQVGENRRELCFEAGDAVGAELIAALAGPVNTL